MTSSASQCAIILSKLWAPWTKLLTLTDTWGWTWCSTKSEFASLRLISQNLKTTPRQNNGGPNFFLGLLSTSLYLEWHNSYTYLTCLSDSFSTRAIKAPVNCQQWPASLSQLTLGHLRVRSLQVVPRYLYKCPLDILITAPSRPLHRRPPPPHPPESNQRRPKKSTSRSKWDRWWFGRRHFFTSQQWLIRPQWCAWGYFSSHFFTTRQQRPFDKETK